jgi:hypothetical protein
VKVRDLLPKNPIRWVAVICVAITSGYVMWMGYKINDVLAGPLWCSRAIGADKMDTNSHVDAANSCVSLLTIQLKSLATNSHILFGVVALCLLTLIVIVIAGAKLDVDLPAKFGGGFHMDRSGATPVEEAATLVAAAATDKAKEVIADPPQGG